MYRKRLFLLFFLLFSSLWAGAQIFWWIGFTDKSGSEYTLEDPSVYLSERALQRRQKQGIPVDALDLPVNREYMSRVLQLGATYIHSSRWLNGMTVRADSAHFGQRVSELPFVREVQITKRNLETTKSLQDKFRVLDEAKERTEIDTGWYGASVTQVGMLNGHVLHQHGFYGQGIEIAVLDAGFYRVNQFPAFDSLWIQGRILGTRDFVFPGSDVFQEHWHGMSVLSVLGANLPGSLMGTAPGASYWLIRSEDTSTEFLLEEDNWVAAAEYADSAGVDILQTSLGYYLFDDSIMNHRYADMDGQTTRVTRAADIAASRGMLVVASAGNEGNNPWKYILAPADGDDVIAVAAVNKEKNPALFTSFGPASDGDIKPNVAALGLSTAIQQSNGLVGAGSGTSYAAPLISGMAACLWQANPQATAKQVKEAIEKSGTLYHAPDSLLGYGIPDFEVADQILKLSVVQEKDSGSDWWVVPNPFRERIIVFQNKRIQPGDLEVNILDLSGKNIWQGAFPSKPIMIINGLSGLPAGICFLQIRHADTQTTVKLIKAE
jgi:serine protease AprX